MINYYITENERDNNTAEINLRNQFLISIPFQIKFNIKNKVG